MKKSNGLLNNFTWYELTLILLPLFVLLMGGVFFEKGIYGSVIQSVLIFFFIYINYKIFQKKIKKYYKYLASVLLSILSIVSYLLIMLILISYQKTGNPCNYKMLIHNGSEYYIWQEFKDSEGGFTILFPGNPVEEKVSYNTEYGVVEGKLFTVKTYNFNCDVSYVDFHKHIISKEYQQEFIIKLIEGIYSNAKKLGALNISNKHIKYKKHNGVELIINYRKNVYVKTRLFFIKNKFYQINVSTNSENKEELCDKYFSSFNIFEK